MEIDKFEDNEIYRAGVEIQEIGNKGIEFVRNENKRHGIPIVFSRGGKIYYELPDGKITTKSPF